jgi:hypothetical protein
MVKLIGVFWGLDIEPHAGPALKIGFPSILICAAIESRLQANRSCFRRARRNKAALSRRPHREFSGHR